MTQLLPERYEAVQALGEGAFGTVYAAVLATREVAVKVLARAERPDLAWQFGAEYRTLARLSHPAFPAAVEQGRTPAGAPFYAMELVAGHAPRGPLPAAEVAAILADVADALAHLHGLGLVHGDLKPENLRLGARTRVLDLGLAAPIGQAREAIAGTLEYLAPEAFRKAPVAPAADLYALGCVGYELLTGRPPFGGSPAELVRGHLTLPPPPVAGELAPLLTSLLAKDPTHRPASALHLLAALGRPVPADALAAPPRALDHQAYLARPEAHAAWERALAAPRPAGVYLAAETGLGKTRTLDALRLEAQLAGRTWLAAAGAGDAPDAPMRAVVAQALAAAELAAEPLVAAWLAGTAPAELAGLEPAARRAVLHGAALGALAQAARRVPLAIGLDDWQLADSASRDWLALALRAEPAPAVAWAVAGAPDAAPALPVVALGPVDVAALVAARLGAAPPADLVDELAAASAGAPAIVDLLLDHHRATGRLQPGAGGWVFTPALTAEAGDRLAAVWAARWDALPAAARRLVALAAVARPAGELPVPTLAAALEPPLAEDELAEALEAALAAGALVGSGGRVRLAVPAAAAYFLGATPAAPIATRLARLLDPAAPDQLAGAARLALVGDDPALAHALALAAGRRALDQGATREALALLEAAAGLPGPDRLAVLLPLADARRFLDRPADAEAAYTEALELAAEPRERALAHIGLAKIRQGQGQYDAALAALEAARQVPDPALRSRAGAAGARLWVFKGDAATAEAWCEAAIADARAADAPATLAQALNLRGYLAIARDLDAAAAALGLLEEALGLARAIGDRVGEGHVLDNLGNARLALGDPRAAAEAFGAYAAIARALGLDAELLSARLNEAIAAGEAGDLGVAAAAAADAAHRAAAANRKFPLAAARAVEGQVAWRAGRPAEAAAPLDEALALAQAIGNKLVEEHVRLYRLEAALALGDLPAADAEIARLEALIAETGHAEARVKLAAHQGERARQAGDPAALEALAPALGSPNRLAEHRARQVAARVLLAAGDRPGARAHAEAARATAAGWGAPWHLAEDLALLAQIDGSAELARAVLATPDNVWARAAAAALLPPGEARVSLPGLAALAPEARARLLAAQGLAEPPATSGAIAPHDFAHAMAALAAARGEDAVAAAALEGVLALTGAERGYVLAYEAGQLRRAVGRGLDVEAALQDGFSSSIAREALFAHGPLYVADAGADATWSQAASVAALELRTVVALPLATPERIFGVLYADRQAVEPLLEPADLALLGTLATTAAAAIARERERHEAEGLAMRWELCAEAGARLARGEGRQGVLELALAVTQARHGRWLARGAEGWAAVLGDGPFSQGIAAAVGDTGESLAILDLGAEGDWAERASVQALGLKTVWCVAVGPDLLYLDTDALPDGRPERWLPLLEALAAYVAPLL